MDEKEDFIDKLYSLNQKRITEWELKYGLIIFLHNHRIYIISSKGYWKISPSSNETKRIVLKHGDNSQIIDYDFTFKEVLKSPYHIQYDCGTQRFSEIITYVASHDANKGTELNQIPTDSKAQKKFYEVTKKRQKKESIDRTMRLFDRIEKERK